MACISPEKKTKVYTILIIFAIGIGALWLAMYKSRTILYNKYQCQLSNSDPNDRILNCTVTGTSDGYCYFASCLDQHGSSNCGSGECYSKETKTEVYKYPDWSTYVGVAFFAVIGVYLWHTFCGCRLCKSSSSGSDSSYDYEEYAEQQRRKQEQRQKQNYLRQQQRQGGY